MLGDMKIVHGGSAKQQICHSLFGQLLLLVRDKVGLWGNLVHNVLIFFLTCDHQRIARLDFLLVEKRVNTYSITIIL